MKRISIFISSAEQELANEREIVGDVIQSMNLNPVLFELSPASNAAPYDAFLDEVSSCDVFVLLLWKDLRPAVLAEYRKAVERNKPILIFLKTCLYGESKSRALSDFLNQFDQSTARQGVRLSCWRDFRTLKQLRAVFSESLMAEVSKYFREPSSTMSREELYDMGTTIISLAQKRLFIYQVTPTLFLGPKTRNESVLDEPPSYRSYEKKFLSTLEDWIEKHKDLEDVEFAYLYNKEQTKAEVKNLISSAGGERARIELKERVIKYRSIETKSDYRFRFTPLDTPVSGPFTIGDNHFAIWVMGGEAAIAFSQENNKIADVFSKMIRIHMQKIYKLKELLEIFE